MNFYEMFIQGLKPALYRNTLDAKFKEKLPFLVERFPYISSERIALVDGAETYIFFQHEEMKKSFAEQLQRITSVQSPDFHRLLGYALGYPPKAVEYFAKTKEETTDGKMLKARKVGMYYLGIGCSGDILDLVENCNWLWDTYGIDSEMEIRIDSDFISVPYGDLEAVQQIRDETLHRLPLVV